MPESASLSLARRRSADEFPLRLAGPLDASAVEHVRHVLERVGAGISYLVLRCDGVTAVDPTAAACLWDMCRDAERRGASRIRLDGMPGRFIRRLRLHPLRRYMLAGDEVFDDPFERPRPSER